MATAAATYNPALASASGTSLVETAGPTTLTMAAVADGKVLVRSGTTITGATNMATWTTVTVTGSAVQSLTIPVASGETSRIVGYGRLIGDAVTLRSISMHINGAATNVILQEMAAAGGTGGLAGTAVLGQFNNQGSYVEMILDCSSKSGAHRRSGLVRVADFGQPNHALWVSTFFYDDISTVITSVAWRGNTAGCIDLGSYFTYQELILS